MQPRVVASSTGKPTLQLGDGFLDDPTDPELAAESFAQPKQLDGAKFVVVFGAGLGYRVARLAALGVREPLVFEPSRDIARLAREHGPAASANARVFHELGALVEFITQHSLADEKLVLLAAPSYRQVFPDDFAALVRGLEDAQRIKIVKRNTLLTHSKPVVECLLQNLPRLEGKKLATSLGQPLAGTPAFVVSAGPSLDKNVALLRDAAAKGVVLVVNTAAPAVAAAGASIDVLVCIEALDCTPAILPALRSIRYAALELAAGEANWASLDSVEKCVFIARYRPFNFIGEKLGAPTLEYGQGVSTAAFALAHGWGASSIVLVGQDLAYSPQGRMYASALGRDHFVAQRGPDGLVIIDEGGTFEDLYAKAGRIRFGNAPAPEIELPAWGGAGKVATRPDLLTFYRWFEAAAVRLAGRVELINATEGGAHIPGFREERLADFLTRTPTRTDRFEQTLARGATVSAEAVEALEEDIVASARVVAQVASEALRRQGTKLESKLVKDLGAAIGKAPLVDAHMAPEMELLFARTDLSTKDRARLTYGAFAGSAKRVLEVAEAAFAKR